MLCPFCGRTWPVTGGIPRFFQPGYYWGEVTQEEANRFLHEARENGWRAAVERRFISDQNMRIGLLDWQRTAWLPLLGLPTDAVALDIGSGYGAITHAVSRGVGMLFSVEAISERIEFTRIRLQQEKIGNVRLVQATGLELPFVDESFDLIVVNGVLEWVGEWATDVSPREVQLRFLRRIHRLLRPGGILLIGIENRFGYHYLRGSLDHSGLPYTSLIPHWMATAYLKLTQSRHRRGELNPRREYRTYIYTERGYRDLLAEGHFPAADFFWSDPGYNQPYHLIPLHNSLPEEHFQCKRAEPSQSWRGGWKRRLKAIAGRTGILRFITPDFVIVTQKDGGPRGAWRQRTWQQLSEALPQLPALNEPVFALSTLAFGKKNLIRVFDAALSRMRVMLKASTAAPGSVETLDSAYRALQTAAQLHAKLPQPLFALPEPLGRQTIGHFVYTAESAAAGLSLAQCAFSASPADRFALLRRELPRAVDVAVQIAGMLRGAAGIPTVNPSWRELPEELRAHSAAVRLAALAREEWALESRQTPWSQHGDFTIENVFVESGRDMIWVIDWEHLVAGTPALYDLFSLLVSALPAVQVEAGVARPGSTPWTERFEAAFFGQGPWTDLYLELLRRACRGLGVSESRAWPQFAQFLLLRANYLGGRGARVTREHLTFLQFAAEQSGRFLLRA
jgi:SAM-dependent methyltransferase